MFICCVHVCYRKKTGIVTAINKSDFGLECECAAKSDFKNNTHNFSIITAQKWSFPLRIYSVNVTKSTDSCGFGHIYWRNPYWKTSFLVQRIKWDTFNKLQFDTSWPTLKAKFFMGKHDLLRLRFLIFCILEKKIEGRRNWILEILY